MTQAMAVQQRGLPAGERTFDVTLDAGPSGEPAFHARLGRVNVVLGANGSGKSRLMRQFAGGRLTAPGAKGVIFVEGGRAIRPPTTLDPMQLGHPHNTLAIASQFHRSQRMASFTGRIISAFSTLAHASEMADSETAEAVRAWENAGKTGPFPQSKPSPLTRCFDMFNEVFPDLHLRIDKQQKVLVVRRDGFPNEYSTETLSDGEKQVLCLLAEIAVLGEAGAFVVVDEPELNLHTSLAIRLWETLEAGIPDGYFTYATHSVPFAMRPGVDTLTVLSAKAAPLVVDHVYDVPPEQLADFLGAAPAMLRSDTLLAVEGHEESFDRPFYTWLLNDPGVTVQPVGDCEQVRTVAQGAGVWEKAAKAGVQTLGVIDRDFRDNAAVKELEAENLVVLALHEAESYLCEPDVFHALAAAVGTVDPAPSPDVIRDRIVAFARQDALGAALRRVAARVRVSLDLSLERNEMGALKTAEAAAEHLAKKIGTQWAGIEWQKPDAILSLIKAELGPIETACEKKNADALLRLIPGKQLLADLARLIGLRSPKEVLNVARKHLRPESLPVLTELRDKLREGLGLTAPVPAPLPGA